MSRLPLFLKTKGRKVLVFGSGRRAQRKLRYLQHFNLELSLITIGEALVQNNDLSVVSVSSLSDLDASIFVGSFAAVAASDSNDENLEFARLAKRCNLLVHVAENDQASDFLLPALIDRGPLSVAISSGGELPTLTRIIRSQIESVLPARIGILGQIAAKYKAKVRSIFPNPQQRRDFWEKHLEGRFAELVYLGKVDEANALIEASIIERSKSETLMGEVYLVGAGPGDPDLLSFKALRLMRQADVVLYDRLVSPAILQMVRHDADLIDVGKERSKHTMPQESINDLLARLALAGRRVLRLKGGDPFIFGRGGEEIETLAAKGVPFQVVPGITAAAGCASYSGIPLTHRDHAQSVRFVTGHLKNHTSNLNWADLVQEQQTLVFYMGLNALSEIANGLVAHGMSHEMPVAIISKGTLPEQKILVSTLEKIVDQVAENSLRAPTIIIVGNVVKLHKKLHWKVKV